MEPKNPSSVLLHDFGFPAVQFQGCSPQLVEQVFVFLKEKTCFLFLHLWSSQNLEWKSSPCWFHHLKTYFHLYLFSELATAIPKQHINRFSMYTSEYVKKNRVVKNVEKGSTSCVWQPHLPPSELPRWARLEGTWQLPAKVFAVWRILMDQSWLFQQIHSQALNAALSIFTYNINGSFYGFHVGKHTMPVPLGVLDSKTVSLHGRITHFFVPTGEVRKIIDSKVPKRTFGGYILVFRRVCRSVSMAEIRAMLVDANFGKEPMKLMQNRENTLSPLHPGRLTWNLQITHLERKMIFKTSMIMFHVNLLGCNHWLTKSGLNSSQLCACVPSVYEETAHVKKNTAPMHMQTLPNYYLISLKSSLNM